MDTPIVCIFCSYQNDHINTIIDHIIGHLNYQPIKCRICLNRFKSIYDFLTHGQHHPRNRDLELEYDPKEILDEWIGKMYNYLGNNKHLKINEDKSCIICKKYEAYFSSIQYQSSLFTLEDCQIDAMTEFKVSQNVFDIHKNKFEKLTKEQIVKLYHIHHHLQYYPFRCTIRIYKKEKQFEKKECDYRVPFIGREFYDHLKKKHNIGFNFRTNNNECFDKKFYIEQLDQIVKKYYVENQNDNRFKGNLKN